MSCFSVDRGGRWLVRAMAVALWVFLCGALGCARDALPGLIDVFGISATTVEAHSDWSVVGRGFPPRRPATVTLMGHAFAPGQKPTDVELRLARVSESRTRIALSLSDDELKPLWNGASHVTFRGDLRVEFAPMRAGGPPLAATLKNVVFDAHRRGASRSSSSDVSAFLAHVGLEVSPTLAVTSVQVGSAAEASGLQAEDQLVEVDEVRVASLADLVPRPGQDFTVLKVQRPKEPESLSLLLDRRGYSRGTAAWANPSLFALIAATLALLFSLRPPRLLLWVLSGSRKKTRSFLDGDAPARGPRLGYALPLMGSLLLDFFVFAAARQHRFTADAALLVLLGLLLVVAAILGTRPRLPGAPGTAQSGNRLAVASAVFVSVLLGSGVGLGQLGGLSFLGGAGVSWPPAPPVLTQGPWLLLSGLGYLGAVALASVWLRRSSGRGSASVLGRLGLVLLVSFWTRLYLVRCAVVGSPLDLILTGALSALILEFITWLEAFVAFASVPRLLGLLFLGLSLPGALVFALTIPFASLRSLSGLGLSTALFLALVLLLVALVRGRSGYQVVRPVDPWI